MASRRNMRYTPLSSSERDDDIHQQDPRFTYNPRALDRVPWKSIGLALFLLFLGSFLLFLSIFVFTGHMGGETSQAYGLLVLGILAFLPGFYETRLAYYSWRGAPGYRYLHDMDLGALMDMPSIRQHTKEKLAKRQEIYRNKLLSSYRDMCDADRGGASNPKVEGS